MGKKAKERLHQLTRPDLSLVETDHLIGELHNRFAGGGFVLFAEWEQEDGRCWLRHSEGPLKLLLRLIREHRRKLINDDGE